jgi:hypothetical protein
MKFRTALVGRPPLLLLLLLLLQCCSAPGRAEVAAARVVAVLAGVLTSAAVCNYILPWYTSSWAIAVLADTYMKSAALLGQMLARTYRDGADAVAKYEAACVPPPTSRSAGQLRSAAADSAGATTDSDSSDSQQQQQQVLAGCVTYSAAEVAAAAAVADAVQEAVRESFPFADLGSSSNSVIPAGAGAAAAGDVGAVDVCSPAVLQRLVARPLVEVQVSLLRDTVAWSRGVLATPPVSAAAAAAAAVGAAVCVCNCSLSSASKKKYATVGVVDTCVLGSMRPASLKFCSAWCGIACWQRSILMWVCWQLG